MEVLFETNDSLQTRGYPLLSTGFYVREAEITELIREAIRLGFELIPYEDMEIKNREKGQAENLYCRTLARDPQAKVIVLAGYAHINEKQAEERSRWMATYFKELAQTDPLTINQTEFEKYSAEFRDHSLTLIKASELNRQLRINSDLLLINNLKDDPAAFIQTKRTVNYSFNASVLKQTAGLTQINSTEFKDAQ